MKKINSSVDDFSKESIVIDEEVRPFPEKTIFYVIGLVFRPLKDNLTRYEIENEGLKKYTGELRSPLIADNEKVFLHNFFKNNHNKVDLLHILNWQDVKQLKEISETIDVAKKKGLLSSLFSVKQKDCLIFLKEDDLKIRSYKKISYSEESEKEDYILHMLSQGWQAYLCEPESHINKMWEEMNEALNGYEKYYPEFYSSNPALWIQTELSPELHLTPEELKELEEDEDFQAELKEEQEEHRRYVEDKNKNDCFDENPQVTYNRLTGFKYI